jgi:hypothetical protein
MELWEVTKSASAITRNSAQSSYKSTGGIASEYSKILAEKLSNVKADIQKMETVQEQLDEIRDMHEELTGEVKVDEDSGNANRDDDGVSTQVVCVEKIKRFMPDGSILMMTYEDGRITEQVRKKPHMVSVPDYSAPPKVDGSPETKLEPRQNLDLMELLMM